MDFKIRTITAFYVGLLLFFLGSCKNSVYNPKPRTYPKIVFPEKSYTRLNSGTCPFSFEAPLYSKLEKDSTFFNDKIENDCWFNLVFPEFNGSLYCSYFPIQNPKELEKHVKDAYKLVREHHVKADFIDEFPILKPNKIFGMIYSIEGPSASPFQFYLPDSAQHFLRGSLYFNSRTNPDSLAPILNFVRIDLSHLINTFEWTVKKEQKK